MKKIYFALFLLTFPAISFAQSSHRLSISYGFAANEMVKRGDLIGGANHDGKGAEIIGFRYVKTLKKNFALETGLEYTKFKFSITPAYHPDVTQTAKKENIELLSVPIYGNYTFGKYFFVNGGLLVDFQINKKDNHNLDRQSGLGAGLGIGGKYDFKRITISVNPYVQKHAIIAANKERHQESILEAGIRIGVGYGF
jgi:hypothetical protein